MTDEADDLEMCPNCPCIKRIGYACSKCGFVAYFPNPPPWWLAPLIIGKETSKYAFIFCVLLTGLLMGAGILLLFLKAVIS